MALDLTPYRAVIFDKDGTLLDFDAMWGAWAEELARRLEAAAGLAMREDLFRLLGYDTRTGRVLANSNLAVTPMAPMRALLLEFLHGGGLSPAAAAEAMETAWHYPDPVLLARPITDLAALFGGLRALGLRVAVATSDDRAGTQATLEALGAARLVDVLACADDGRPIKPRPDMILAVCAALGLEPAQTVMVGDSQDDMRMGRAAGAGLVVGVTSGVSAAELLAPYADVVLGSVAELLAPVPFSA